jgi:hypothetical protein
MATGKKASLPRVTSGPLKGHVVPKKYRKLPASDFALGDGRYPINTPKRARSALSRIVGNGTPAQQVTVQTAVRKRYPSIAVGGKSGKNS